MSDLFTHGHALVIGMGADLPVTITDAQGIAALLRDPPVARIHPSRSNC